MEALQTKDIIFLTGANLFDGLQSAYPEKRAVVDYLRQSGEEIFYSFGEVYDFKGDFVSNVGETKTDGYFYWNGLLTYYAEKYNTRLPKDIEDHILKQVATKKK